MGYQGETLLQIRLAWTILRLASVANANRGSKLFPKTGSSPPSSWLIDVASPSQAFGGFVSYECRVSRLIMIRLLILLCNLKTQRTANTADAVCRSPEARWTVSGAGTQRASRTRRTAPHLIRFPNDNAALETGRRPAIDYADLSSGNAPFFLKGGGVDSTTGRWLDGDEERRGGGGKALKDVKSTRRDPRSALPCPPCRPHKTWRTLDKRNRGGGF